MSRNGLGRSLARGVLGAALSATIALGAVAPSAAWAETPGGTGTGTLTISSAQGNAVSSYKAIKIFTADVLNEGDAGAPRWVATDLDWASAEVKDAVIAAIHEKSPTYVVADAQDAADFLVANIQGSDHTTIVPSDSFANTLASKIASAVADAQNQLAADYTIAPGTATQVVEGYYLVIVDTTELGGGAAGTSPILLMMGDGQTLSITEKVTVPTLSKTVGEDSSIASTRYADAQVGQELDFTLTGTVAGNIASYTSYRYEFSDTLSAGLDLKTDGGTNPSGIDAGDVTVKVTNTATDTSTAPPTTTTTTYSVTSGFTATYAPNAMDVTKHDLKVSFADLKAAGGTQDGVVGAPATTIPIDSSSVITVGYKASLNGSSVMGTTAGNPNSVTLTYSNMPSTSFTGVTEPATATVYSYALKLVKVDKDHELDDNADTNTYLTGARFTIRATTTDEGAVNNGRYLKNDGTFGATALPATTSPEHASYLFTTAGADGSFTVRGIDAGTYTIHEVEAPTNYDTIDADLVLTLTANKNATTLQPTSVTVALAGGEGDGVDSTGGGLAPDKGTRVSFDSSTGTVSIVATNQKEEELPLTGLSGITVVYVAGGVMLAVSLATIVRRRANEEK